MNFYLDGWYSKDDKEELLRLFREIKFVHGCESALIADRDGWYAVLYVATKPLSDAHTAAHGIGVK